jgi:parallel beta-helix repeat protein
VRKAFATLLTILLFSVLALQLNFGAGSADSYYGNFAIAVTPEAPSTHDTVNVTVSFETNYIYAIPANFSILSHQGNNFSVTIEVYPIHDNLSLPVTGYEEETYNLGTLSAGLYHFNAEVQVWSAPPDEPSRMLLESDSYTHSFSVAAVAITVPDDYPTIQAAINAATEGHTVFVRNGTYIENVVVNKTLSLVGENRETTVIDGDAQGTVVNITADNVNLRGFTVQNCYVSLMSYRSVIYVSSWGNNISDNIVRNSSHFDTTCGIWLDNASHNTIQRNSILLNGLAGIFLEDSRNNTIVHNHVVANAYEGIFLVGSQGNRISDNNVSWNMDTGIYLMSSANNTISGNHATNNGNAIFLEGSNHNRVYNNNASFHDEESPAAGFGISLRESSYCTISRNIATDNTLGMLVFYSDDNAISHNVLARNNNYGIELAFYAANNTVWANTIAENSVGIRLADGFSDITTVFHNNFIDNLQNVEAYSPAIWDNGCEGNYWSNYNGTDLDHDGVGDTYLPWEGVDNYPLMNQYWNPADIDHDLDVDIFDVVKCAIAYGSTPSDPHWNPHCDIAEPYAKVDIFDIVLMVMSYGEEYTP